MRRECCHSGPSPLDGTLVLAAFRHRSETSCIRSPHLRPRRHPSLTFPAKFYLRDPDTRLILHSVPHKAAGSRCLRWRWRWRTTTTTTTSAPLFFHRLASFLFLVDSFFCNFIRGATFLHDADTQRDNNRLRNKSAAVRTQAR